MERGDDADANWDSATALHDLANCLARGVGDRDDDVVDAQLRDKAGQVGGAAENSNARHDGVLLVGIVVDETTDIETLVSPAADFSNGHHTRGARPDQKNRNAPGERSLVLVSSALLGFPGGTTGDTNGNNAAKGEHRIHENDAQGDAEGGEGVRKKQTASEQNRRCDECRLDEDTRLGHSDVPPDGVEGTEAAKGGPLDQNGERELNEETLLDVPRE